jgi:hypothetical protein
MRLIVLSILMATTLACAPRTAQQGAAKPVAVAGDPSKKPAEDIDKPVCRQERSLGSNIPHVVCMTKRQMDENQRQAQEILQRPTQSTAKPGG